MGLMVGNMEMLGLGHHDEHATLLEGFLGQVAEIATLLVFVTLGLNLPFDLRVGMDGFEENFAEALNQYLKLPEEERRGCEEVVRRNCVEHLSWGTLAEKLVALVG